MQGAQQLTSDQVKKATHLCDQEPVHHIGSIQAHGALCVVDSTTGTVSHASSNLKEWAGLSPSDVCGQATPSWLATHIAFNSKSAPEEPTRNMDQLRSVSTTALVHPPENETLLATIIPGNNIFIELSRAEWSDFPTGANVDSFHHRIRPLFDAENDARLYHEMAQFVHELTDFDRVKVYKFDATWSGEVIAEARRPHMTSYLGLRFPASDIPAQARAVYARTQVRAIPDVNAPTYELMPWCGPSSSAPLDLSRSYLRAISPIHLQYLRNMDVGASLSISLMRENQLWGLIACHNHLPKSVPMRILHAAEVLSTLASNQISLRHSLAASQKKISLYSQIATLRRPSKSPILDDFPSRIRKLAKQFDAPLSYCRTKDITVGSGDPAVDAFADTVIDYLERETDDTLFATSSLPSLIPQLMPIRSQACGLMALRVGPNWSDCVFFYRPEQHQEILWAGQKDLGATTTSSGALAPRQSFATWLQKVELTSRPFEPPTIEAGQELQNVLFDIFIYQNKTELKRSLTYLEEKNKDMEEFVHSVSHDLQSPVAIIDGYLGRAVRALKDSDLTRGINYLENIKTASDRLRQNIGDLLELSRVGHHEHSLEVTSLLPIIEECSNRMLDVFSKEEPFAIQISGSFGSTLMPTLRVEQVIENLLGNAIKYGLTDENRTIWIIGVLDDSSVRVTVKDRGPGIPAKFADKAFRMFSRLHGESNKPGTGVGLPLVRRIMTTYGGAIELDSTGPGAAFTASFPRARRS